MEGVKFLMDLVDHTWFNMDMVPLGSLPTLRVAVDGAFTETFPIHNADMVPLGVLAHPEGSRPWGL